MEAARGNNHGLCPAADLVHSEMPEMLYHHFCLLCDIVRVKAHEPRQCPGCFLLIYFGVVFNGLYETIIGLVGSVVLQHVEDKSLLDRLSHGIKMKGLWLSVRTRPSEDLQSFVFRRCRKSIEAYIRLSTPLNH